MIDILTTTEIMASIEKLGLLTVNYYDNEMLV